MSQGTESQTRVTEDTRRSYFWTDSRNLGPRWKRRSVIVSLASADFALTFVIWTVEHLGRELLGFATVPYSTTLTTLLSSVMVWIALRAMMGLYPGYGMDSVERLRRHTYSVILALGILALLTLGFGVGETILSVSLGFSFLALLVLGPLVRQISTAGLRYVGLWGRPVIVLSYKATGTKFLELLEAEWGLGYRSEALFDYNLVPAGESFENAPYLDTLSDAERFARERRIDTIIFAMPHTRRAQLADLVEQASESFRYVLVVPNLTGITNSAVIARDLGGTFAVEIKHNLLDPWARRLKRFVDLSVSVIGGIAILPLTGIIAALIKLETRGTVFYGHKRLGAYDEYFSCWKFRTMYAEADRLLTQYLEEVPEMRLEWEQTHKLRNDPRVTRVGSILRKTSLDELPQLWNVFRGQMSLTGPRPIVSDEVARYKEGYKLYRRIKPGMSGLWQVSGRSDVDYAERVEMDSYYVRNWSIWLDVVILARTLKIVLKGRGAY